MCYTAIEVWTIVTNNNDSQTVTVRLWLLITATHWGWNPNQKLVNNRKAFYWYNKPNDRKPAPNRRLFAPGLQFPERFWSFLKKSLQGWRNLAEFRTLTEVKSYLQSSNWKPDPEWFFDWRISVFDKNFLFWRFPRVKNRDSRLKKFSVFQSDYLPMSHQRCVIGHS